VLPSACLLHLRHLISCLAAFAIVACCSGAAWRTLRSAWQPAFGSAALEGYASGMNTAAEELAQRLHSAAASGEEVELFGWV
jgi:cytochrome P450